MDQPISAIPSLAARNIDYRRTTEIKQTNGPDKDQLREQKLRRTAQDFESLFISKLLKSMRSTVPENEAGQFGMGTMREIIDEQLAGFLARQGGIGLAEMMINSLRQPTLIAAEPVVADGQESAAVRPPGVNPPGKRVTQPPIALPAPKQGIMINAEKTYAR